MKNPHTIVATKCKKKLSNVHSLSVLTVILVDVLSYTCIPLNHHIGELKQARFWDADGNQKWAIFTFNLPSHNHIHIAKNLFSIKDKQYKIWETLRSYMYIMRSILFWLPSVFKKHACLSSLLFSAFVVVSLTF